MVATSTDAEGRFRLDGMFPGTRYAFVRKPGYRFTGIKVDDDADGLTITLNRTGRAAPRVEARRTARAPTSSVPSPSRSWSGSGRSTAPTPTTTARSSASGTWPRSTRTWPCSGRPRRGIGTTTGCVRPRPGTWPRPTPTARLALLNQKPDTPEPVRLAGAGRSVRGDRPARRRSRSPRRRRSSRAG